VQRIKEGLMAISHHFQTLTYQALPTVMLEYVGLCWVIFGCDGYNLVTVQQRRRDGMANELGATNPTTPPIRIWLGFLPARFKKISRPDSKGSVQSVQVAIGF